MKFSLTFKTPDVLDQLLEEGLSYRSEDSCDCGGTCLNCQQLTEQSELEMEKMKKFAKEYVVYDEYITILFDTIAKTATVRKAK